MKKTLDQTNPDYFEMVKQRTNEKISLDCFKQTHDLLQQFLPINYCLDIGCASGYLYHHINDLVQHYHGIDASEQFIKYGADYFKKQAIKNVTLTHSWFEFNQFEQEFDVSICLGLF